MNWQIICEGWWLYLDFWIIRRKGEKNIYMQCASQILSDMMSHHKRSNDTFWSRYLQWRCLADLIFQSSLRMKMLWITFPMPFDDEMIVMDSWVYQCRNLIYVSHLYSERLGSYCAYHVYGEGENDSMVICWPFFICDIKLFYKK